MQWRFLVVNNHEDFTVIVDLYKLSILDNDRSQDMSENITSVKLFQLFFTVKEIKNIVKQTNQWAAYMIFKSLWVPITVTEIYHYLECLIYMKIQSLQELHDY